VVNSRKRFLIFKDLCNWAQLDSECFFYVKILLPEWYRPVMLHPHLSLQEWSVPQGDRRSVQLLVTQDALVYTFSFDFYLTGVTYQVTTILNRASLSHSTFGGPIYGLTGGSPS
jgi:hypothetical protein